MLARTPRVLPASKRNTTYVCIVANLLGALILDLSCCVFIVSDSNPARGDDTSLNQPKKFEPFILVSRQLLTAQCYTIEAY